MIEDPFVLCVVIANTGRWRKGLVLKKQHTQLLPTDLKASWHFAVSRGVSTLGTLGVRRGRMK